MKTVFSVIVILVGMSLVSIFLVAAPPSQNEPDRAEDAATLAAMEKAAKESDMPVSFFGKVLDQNGKAVEGAQVQVRLSHYDPKNAPRGYYTASKTIPRSTDASGLFFVENELGTGLHIGGISKAGYEFLRSQNKESGFSYLRYHADRHTPDKAKPVLFHLRKLGPQSFLLRSSGLKPVAVHPDGKSHVVEFSNARNMFLPDDSEQFPGLEVSASLDSSTRDWVLEFKGKHEGDAVVLADQIVYEAPERGYQSSAELRLSLQKNVVSGGQPTYPFRTEVFVVVRSAKPETYARLDLKITTSQEEDACYITYQFTVNPYGDRTFEWATEIDDYLLDIGPSLRKEAIHALCSGELPRKPDIPKLIEGTKKKSHRGEGSGNE